MGFSRQGYWSGLPCPPSGDLPNPGIEPVFLVSLALQADSLPTEPPGKTLELSRTQFHVSLNKWEGGRGCREAAKETLTVTLKAGVWGGERGPLAACIPAGPSWPPALWLAWPAWYGVCAAHFIALNCSSTDTTSAVLHGLPDSRLLLWERPEGRPFLILW